MSKRRKGDMGPRMAGRNRLFAFPSPWRGGGSGMGGGGGGGGGGEEAGQSTPHVILSRPEGPCRRTHGQLAWFDTHPAGAAHQDVLLCGRTHLHPHPRPF